MRGLKLVIGVSLLIAILLPAELVLAWNNNGWETDWSLANRARAGFKIKTFLEPSQITEVGSDDSGIEYLSGTFSGTGNNDARYFTIRPSDTVNHPEELANDLMICELGAVVDPNTIRPETNKASLRALGYAGTNEPGTRNIRYNPITDSLFMATREREVAGPTTMWEINLDLTLANTMAGPNVTDMDEYSVPTVTVNHHDGTVYEGCAYLNTAMVGKGDVVEFDLNTGLWSVTIDSTLTGAEYTEPQGLCYRDNSIIVGFGSYDKAHQPIEYNLAGGSTQLSGYPYAEPFWNGQLDMVTGSIWSVGHTGTQAANLGAIYELTQGSTTAIDNPLGGNRYQKFYDIASPAPEPATLALLAIGLLVLRRRR